MADAYQMFIDGEWVNSSDGQTRDVINPATGEVAGHGTGGHEGGREHAPSRPPSEAFEGDWFDSTPKDRQLALLKFADRDRGERRRDREARGAERRASRPP